MATYIEKQGLIGGICLKWFTYKFEKIHLPLCSTQMQTYSREYLQSLPDKKNQAEIERLINIFKANLEEAAANGYTSYFFDMTSMRYIPPADPRFKAAVQTKSSLNYQTSIRNDVIVNGFQIRFTGCSVSYSEDWMSTSANTKVLKKGITIDWS
jgi:hypothetical protein